MALEIFEDLTTAEVYAMLAARSAVFVIEQNCLYGDIDGLDRCMASVCLWSYGPVKPGRRSRAICAYCCPTLTTPISASAAS